jgi:hypothetical protein
MISEIGDVWHALFRLGKELLVGWDVHSRGSDLQTQCPPRMRMHRLLGQQACTHGLGQGEKTVTCLTTRSFVLIVRPSSS